jgi:aspartate aminotransferase
MGIAGMAVRTLALALRLPAGNSTNPDGSYDRVAQSSDRPGRPGDEVTAAPVAVSNGWTREADDVLNQDISLMTLLEKQCYLDPRNRLNVTYGYPEGLNPDWIISYQLNPPDDFLSVPPAEYISVIRGYFQNLFHSANVNLAPTCSLAFMIAAKALIRSGSDEIIMMEPTYDSYAHIVRSFNATVVYAKREVGNSVSIDSVREQYTEHTKAIVLCCPDNPLGVVYARDTFEQIITFCKQRNITLVVDYCLAEVSPFGTEVPIVSRLGSSKDLSYILIGDTGKILGLNGSKFGAISYSDNWRTSLEVAEASYFFQYNQYDLYLLSTILADIRFRAYLESVNAQIAENYKYLQQALGQTFHVSRMEAGCFCLIDIGELGLDDVAYTTLLMDNYAVLVIPMSFFYVGRQAPANKIRISLARSMVDIRRLAGALNSSQAQLARDNHTLHL